MMSMALAAMIVSAIAPCGATQPNAPREDVFGRNTGPAPAPTRAPISGHVSSVRINPPATDSNAPHPQVTANSTPEQWFDAFDQYFAYYKPTEEDRFVMNQPFNQEVEKVTAFCKTVTKVAKNYRALAQKLKAMPIPKAMPEAQKYRNLRVNWYNDAALLYEDMVRPRPPARTKEELNRMIQEIKDTSEGLKANHDEVLQKMDSEIRMHYHVNPPKYDDPIFKYAGHH